MKTFRKRYNVINHTNMNNDKSAFCKFFLDEETHFSSEQFMVSRFRIPSFLILQKWTWAFLEKDKTGSLIVPIGSLKLRNLIFCFSHSHFSKKS